MFSYKLHANMSDKRRLKVKPVALWIEQSLDFLVSHLGCLWQAAGSASFNLVHSLWQFSTHHVCSEKYHVLKFIRSFQTEQVTAESSLPSLLSNGDSCITLHFSSLPSYWFSQLEIQIFLRPLMLYQTHLQVASRFNSWWGQMGRHDVTESSFP